MKRTRLQTVLSDVGYSSLKRLAVFCATEKRQYRACAGRRWKPTTVNQTNFLAIVIRLTIVWSVVHNRLLSVPTKCRFLQVLKPDTFFTKKGAHVEVV
jgi:hypothetical protein